MRNVTELSKIKGKVMVYVGNRTVERKFLHDAEEEGFMFGNSIKPTDSPEDDLYVVHRDWTLGHAGWAGHMALMGMPSPYEKLYIIDYEKYLFGEEDYYYIPRRRHTTI